MTKLSIKKFKDALVGSHGIQAIIAKRCQVDRSTITNFLDKHPKLRKVCILERERIIVVAENRLFKSADDGQKWAVDKVLSTIGKSRGYVETQDIKIAGNISTLTKEERSAEIKRLLGK